MKVEVWSDIVCPFCYIGKKNYEKALREFAGAAEVELEWKSFQLDPTIPQGVSYSGQAKYLSEQRGMPIEQIQSMLQSVTATAAAAGIEMNLEQSFATNTLHAHRLLHFAKSEGLGDALKDRLFRAHFTEGLDVGDRATLVQLAVDVGLDKDRSQAVLEGDQYAYEVNQDIQEAANIGVTGVPFFVFNRKYAVSGAQPAEVFLQTLEKSFTEWKESQPKPTLQVVEGPSCSPETGCD